MEGRDTRWLRAALAIALAFQGLAAGDGGARPFPGDDCPGLSPGRPGLSAVIAGAVGVLRRAGHDPSAYELEVRSTNRTDSPTVVFLPREGGSLYPVEVRPEEPCALRWVWRPEQLTVWQVAAVELARELLRGSAPWPSGELEEVSMFETADTLTVRLRHGRPDAPFDGSETHLTLSKDDVRPGAGASRTER